MRSAQLHNSLPSLRGRCPKRQFTQQSDILSGCLDLHRHDFRVRLNQAIADLQRRGEADLRFLHRDHRLLEADGRVVEATSRCIAVASFCDLLTAPSA